MSIPDWNKIWEVFNKLEREKDTSRLASNLSGLFGKTNSIVDRAQILWTIFTLYISKGDDRYSRASWARISDFCANKYIPSYKLRDLNSYIKNEEDNKPVSSDEIQSI